MLNFSFFFEVSSLSCNICVLFCEMIVHVDIGSFQLFTLFDESHFVLPIGKSYDHSLFFTVTPSRQQVTCFSVTRVHFNSLRLEEGYHLLFHRSTFFLIRLLTITGISYC
uniref:Uncharacterized protein n=1 Tax=Nothobranchius kadleci TaxID=1051664 RepID=A0A1A8BUF3_NOTKA